MKAIVLVLLVVAGIFLGSPQTLEGLSVTSGLDSQVEVEVTVYNSNVGLVKDVRKMQLPAGAAEVRFMDVAAQVIPASVNIKSITAPDRLTVLEQNYEYDLISPRKLLDKYVGKEVKLRSKNPYTDKEEIVTATVISNNEGTPVYKINNGITYGHYGTIIFPEIPENLISKPTLVWILDNKGPEAQQVEALYLTGGITWQADYVLLLDRLDRKADLSGWVTITNKSGAGYRDARLKLVAGDVHRVTDDAKRGRMLMAEAKVAGAAPQFQESEFFEYHIYSLQRKSTIKENQTKQIGLLDGRAIPVKKEFLYRGMPEYYRNRYGDLGSTKKVEVYVEFQNRKEHGLGIPLPKGTLRVYKEDSDGSLQFAGEDRIDHTPRNEKVRVKMGTAFDITATRKQTAWEKIGTNLYEVAFEIVLKNHKKEDVSVKVVEPLSGDWKVLESSHGHAKVDAFTASFDIPVKKEGEAKLTYRARIRY